MLGMIDELRRRLRKYVDVEPRRATGQLTLIPRLPIIRDVPHAGPFDGSSGAEASSDSRLRAEPSAARPFERLSERSATARVYALRMRLSIAAARSGSAGAGQSTRRLSKLAAALAMAGLLAAGALAPATAMASDDTVTETYIQANYRLVAAASSQLPAMRAALHGVLRTVQRDCPQAAAASPQNADSEQLSNELVGDMVTSAARLLAPAARAFSRAVGHLGWSDPSITRAVRNYVRRGDRLTALSPPHLCADIESWKASGYTALPAETVSFDAAFMPNWVSPGELPEGLSRYENGREGPMLRRTELLEAPITEMEVHAVETYGDIMNALELWP